MKTSDKNMDKSINGEIKEENVVKDNMADIGIDRTQMSDAEYIGALEERLGQMIAELDSCKSLMQRIQADFENYRKRNVALATEMKSLGQTAVIEKMLTVLDNCDLARKYIHDEASLTGFNMMEKQILGALEGFGLEFVETEGLDFDANTMAAVERVKNESMQGKVVETLAKGYKLGGKLLRPASVKVGYWE